MRYDVVGLGIASLDLIGVTEEQPLFGAKQSLTGWHEMGGGPVATALATLARMGARVAMTGAVGNDGYGQRILADLQTVGIDTQAMHVRPGTSHVSFVLAEPGRDRRTVWWHNDPTVLEQVPLEHELIRSARALLIDTHMPQVALHAARTMQATGGLVMIDAERVREHTLELLPLCNLIVVSAEFARQATGVVEPWEAARVLHSRYEEQLVIVTCGAEGSWCANKGELFHTPAFEIEPLDTTGAGDVFHGALLYALLRDDPIRLAIRFASAAAALSCQGLGGRGNLPTVSEVEALLEPA
ncbi:PfkB family carbohydrate kinase [Candidatus Chloroploca asiatica]|uniref:Ribokinase n=1 Tax=Candidatus Chloroploca asiatica TaxID=1506545 RepID=A0A2H3LCI4_9CHLR|nr:PfkB family carbohydrate kinase [Candidatus Chloroploca asiatica]PDW00198.1 ribokinase [Candidatus Chloroploca asiatica]